MNGAERPPGDDGACGTRAAQAIRAGLLALAAFAALALLAGLGACEPLGLTPKTDHRKVVLEGMACDTCHEPGKVGTASPITPAPLRFDHDAHVERHSGNCMRCHPSVVRGGDHAAAGAEKVSVCIECHGGGAAALACLSCHESIGPGATVPASHDKHGAGFRLTHPAAALAPETGANCANCHARPFCGSCHDTSAPLAELRMFPAETVRATAHPLEWVALHDLEAKRAPDRCIGCHAVDECAACHTTAGVASSRFSVTAGLSPHPAGWVTVPTSLGGNLHGEVARRDVVACATCHADGTSCVRCHATGGPGGSPHPPGSSPRGSLSAPGCAPCHSK